MDADLESRYDADVHSPGFLLWRVTNRWQSAVRSALAPFDLTHVQFVLLAVLTWARRDDPDGVMQIELARRAGADPMMVSQVLRALERRGLITRGVHPTDGRALLIRATEDGIALANRANAAVEAADVAFFGAAADRRRTLIDHLAVLDGHVHDRSAPARSAGRRRTPSD